jgi:hypothetical protein
MSTEPVWADAGTGFWALSENESRSKSEQEIARIVILIMDFNFKNQCRSDVSFPATLLAVQANIQAVQNENIE